MAPRRAGMDGFRILTIDGGGIRGVVPAIVLERLCAEPELASWLDHVDLFAGTSTGGILALGLAAGLSVSTIRDLYEQRSASVFHDTLFDARTCSASSSASSVTVRSGRSAGVFSSQHSTWTTKPPGSARGSRSCSTTFREATATRSNSRDPWPRTRARHRRTSNRSTAISTAACTPRTRACARWPRRRIPACPRPNGHCSAMFGCCHSAPAVHSCTSRETGTTGDTCNGCDP
ncbi:MAG: hypothetical protein E6G60_20440 [Actinobacteria bacterium]|nr:MAG: hypothetical protein E6G60_20440 [Actinomycetota bacterium]